MAFSLSTVIPCFSSAAMALDSESTRKEGHAEDQHDECAHDDPEGPASAGDGGVLEVLHTVADRLGTNTSDLTVRVVSHLHGTDNLESLFPRTLLDALRAASGVDG